MSGLPRIKFGRFHDIGNVKGAFARDDLTIRVLLALARVALNHVNTFDDDPLFLCGNGDDASAFAFIGPGDDHHFVILLYVKALHISYFRRELPRLKASVK